MDCLSAQATVPEYVEPVRTEPEVNIASVNCIPCVKSRWIAWPVPLPLPLHLVLSTLWKCCWTPFWAYVALEGFDRRCSAIWNANDRFGLALRHGTLHSVSEHDSETLRARLLTTRRLNEG